MDNAEQLLQPVLAEYDGNPFIARLPPLQTQAEMLVALASTPVFGEHERQYPAQLRKHCIARLSRYLEPLDRQLQLAERFAMLLRQGYVGRNPLTHDYIRHLQNGHQRIEAKSLHVAALHPVENTASSFAIVGCSGIGKSKSIEKILHQYPQCIQHTEPFSLVQIVWLKLDCPHLGSPKQLCINFFSAVDRLLGTNYMDWYGRQSKSVDEMMVHMAHVANLHALGVLVIDEIQHLSKSKVGPEALLNFLVTLVNTISVPVILIGTLSAVPLLQQNFRQARRASGLGSVVWDRIPNDKTWNYFVDRMWQYQWTGESTPISPDIRAALYDESQGILDIVVKLFMLAQLRLVGIAGVRGKPEHITARLIRQVAREDFRIVQPMLEALRRNDANALLKYDDLLPFHKHVEQAMASAMQSQVPEAAEPKAGSLDSDGTATSSGANAPILTVLESLGVATDVGRILLNEAQALHPSGDPLILMATISEKLASCRVKPVKQRQTKKPKSTEKPEGDLRRIVESGRKDKLSGYESLLAAAMIRPPLAELAA